MMRSGVAKKSNSSRRRFWRKRSKEKWRPGLPPAVKTTKAGGGTPTPGTDCTGKIHCPPPPAAAGGGGRGGRAPRRHDAREELVEPRGRHSPVARLVGAQGERQ